MTAFDPATQLPADIDTVEKAAHYFLSILYRLHKEDNYQRVPNQSREPLVTNVIGLDAEGQERAIYTVSLPMHPDYQTSVNPVFIDTLEFGSGSIPVAFYS